MTNPTQGIDPKCPECERPLQKVRNPSGSMLNDEQFDAIRAGDWFCTAHTNGRGNRPYAYYWDRELQPSRAASEPVRDEVVSMDAELGDDPERDYPEVAAVSPTVAYVSDCQYPECTETCAVCGAVREPNKPCDSCGSQPQPYDPDWPQELKQAYADARAASDIQTRRSIFLQSQPPSPEPQDEGGENEICATCRWPKYSHNATHFCQKFFQPATTPSPEPQAVELPPLEIKFTAEMIHNQAARFEAMLLERERQLLSALSALTEARRENERLEHILRTYRKLLDSEQAEVTRLRESREKAKGILMDMRANSRREAIVALSDSQEGK